MTLTSLSFQEIGAPDFSKELEGRSPLKEPSLFDLTSHKRALEALNFGLQIRALGYNIFVMGEDHSGRMTATLAHLKKNAPKLKEPQDWIYLNNFKEPHSPLPFALPKGMGLHFKKMLSLKIEGIIDSLLAVMASPDHKMHIQQEGGKLQEHLAQELEKLSKETNEAGLSLHKREDGFLEIAAQTSEGIRAFTELPTKERKSLKKRWQEFTRRLHYISQEIHEREDSLADRITKFNQLTTYKVSDPYLEELEQEFSKIKGLDLWLEDLRRDIVETLSYYLQATPEALKETIPAIEERYAVNLFVDNSETTNPIIIVEPNPTYENLFGTIAYQSINGNYTTHFSMIRAGSLHRANGGYLVIRAENIADQPKVWDELKQTLRDRLLTIKEPQRENSTPLYQTPSPHPIPLDLQIILIGHPRWYYRFFYADPDFKSYFKIKADIDPTLPTDKHNLLVYKTLLENMAKDLIKTPYSKEAMASLLSYSSRVAKHRKRLTARIEQMADLLLEAETYTQLRKGRSIAQEDMEKAFEARRYREMGIEEESRNTIKEGTILISTTGKKIGQINGLTVAEVGQYAFGTPARITARTFVGKFGIINIERVTDMGGPIQQKGVFVLGGYLNGTFCQKFTPSFSCSLTFEQLYDSVEGDSASLAELCTIISSLSEVPLRQDIAVTGSINQFGEIQAVGGVSEKVEGFFHVCLLQGLTGTQGVCIPAANRDHLILSKEVIEAIKAGKFHLWAASTAEDALALLTDEKVGSSDTLEDETTIFGKAYKKLKNFHTILEHQNGSLAFPLRAEEISPQLLADYIK